MSNTFFNESEAIADKFIQNVLFVDDEIYSDKNDKKHNLDGYELIRSFSRAKKLCALNNPKSEEDFEDIIEIAKKTDISVLDWKMNLKKRDLDDDEEADVEEADPRGNFTLKLIESIIYDEDTSGTFRLIMIYTGETILQEIVAKIHNYFEDFGLQKISENSLGKLNIKIVVAGKPTLKGSFKHASNLNDWIVDYNDIPTFIVQEFASATEGLISNFVLSSLTIIRENTFKLVNLFDNELDSAFLLHRILLPRQEDSGDHLIEIFTHSISALLNYNSADETVSTEIVKNWVDSRDYKNKVSIAGQEFQINREFIKNCVEEGFVQTVEKNWEGELSKNKRQEINKFFNKLYLKNPELFNFENHNNPNERFSILTHHKSNLKLPSKIPILSLGTIIRSKATPSNYLICIQAKCDSVRIVGVRKFLFLPLKLVTGDSKFDLIIQEDSEFSRLKISRNPFELKTIKFLPTGDTQSVQAIENNGKYEFNAEYEEQYEWMAELKDAHAQRVANNFGANVSRVGLDESEWLRRWSS